MINVGTVLEGRYEILKDIDKGGMSIIYLARDNRLKKLVAIKDILKRENRKSGSKISDELLLTCLKKESDLLVALDHYSLPKIYDILEGPGHIYVVMDYIEGETLKNKLDREGKCDVDDVIDWGRQLSGILDYLHDGYKEQVIYRDMKPHNVMLTPEGKIKLIDFGTAILEKKIDSSEDSTKNLGTAIYAAPEQKAKGITNVATDIYSLGVVLYQLVTGEKLTKSHEFKPIREVNPNFPEGLEYIISKCVNEDPTERYESADELLYDLENVNKLSRDYRKNLIKQMSLFLISLSIFAIATTTMFIGYRGIKTTKVDTYKELINDANFNAVEGNYSKSIELLNKAIVKVDSSSHEAYVRLLDLYIRIGDTKTGLATVENYINDKFGNIHKNNYVLFKVAMTYLETKNYPLALKYFNYVDIKRIPNVKYYRTLSTIMSSMNIDFVSLQTELDEFEEFVDISANDEMKIGNYLALINIYSSYKGQIANANDRIIEIVNKADITLENIDDENLKTKYEVDVTQKLASAYHSKGSNSIDAKQAKGYFNNAMNLYEELLKLDVNNREDILIKIGDIFIENKEYNEAINHFKDVTNKYPQNIKAYAKLINTLLDVEQISNNGTPNYSQAKSYYNIAVNIEGASENQDFKKLIRRMTNLEII